MFELIDIEDKEEEEEEEEQEEGKEKRPKKKREKHKPENLRKLEGRRSDLGKLFTSKKTGKEFSLVGGPKTNEILEAVLDTPPGLYEISVYGEMKPNSSAIFDAYHNIEWTTKPKITVDEIRGLLLGCGLHDVEKELGNWGPWNFDVEGYLVKTEEERNLYEVDTAMIIDILKTLPLSTNPTIKTFLYWREIGILCGGTNPIYELRDIFKLSPVGIDALWTQLNENCLPLCVDNKWELPPLDSARLQKIFMRRDTMKRSRDDDFAQLVIEIKDRTNATIMEQSTSTAVLMDELYFNSQEKDALLYLIKHHVFVEKLSMVTTPKIMFLEKCLAKAMQILLRVPPKRPDMRLYDFSKWNTGLHPPCSEQEVLLTKCLQRRMISLQGVAGSGKTASVRHLRYIYKNQYACMIAFQNRNVSMLRRIFPNAFTIHSLLNRHMYSCPKAKKGEGKCFFSAFRFICIDEASMLDLEMVSKLLSLFALCGDSVDLVLIMGDINQLAPIRIGQPFPLLYQWMKERDMAVEFFHVHRTGDAKLVAENNKAIAKSDFSAIKWDDNCFIHRELEGDLAGTIIGILSEFKVEQDKSLIATRTNVVVATISGAASTYYYPDLKVNSRVLRVGCKLSPNVTDKVRGFCNNEIMILRGIRDVYGDPVTDDEQIAGLDLPKMYMSDGAREVSTADTSFRYGARNIRIIKCQLFDTPEIEYRYFYYDRYAMKHLVTRYCLTVNKSQGGEAHTVIVVIPKDSPYEDRPRMVAAFTRAKERVIYLGSKHVLERAINRVPSPPCTMLPLLLQESFR